MNNYSFLPLQKQIIHVESFIPTKCSCTITWPRLIFIILPDIFAFWVTYQCMSFIEEVSYVLCDSYKHFIYNPTFGSKTGTTNGGKACRHLQWMSVHQTRPCSRPWSNSWCCPQCNHPCSQSCSHSCSLLLRFTSSIQFCDNMVAICHSDKWLHV